MAKCIFLRCQMNVLNFVFVLVCIQIHHCMVLLWYMDLSFNAAMTFEMGWKVDSDILTLILNDPHAVR